MKYKIDKLDVVIAVLIVAFMVELVMIYKVFEDLLRIINV